MNKFSKDYLPSLFELSFSDLREANIERIPLFKKRDGTPAHEKRDGSCWSLTDWATSMAGEAGEACNIVKKIRREDLSLDEAREALAKEIADVIIYADILAFRAGICLADAIKQKFNEVSDKQEIDIYL